MWFMLRLVRFLALLLAVTDAQTLSIPAPTPAESDARLAWLQTLRGLPANTDHELATFVLDGEPAGALRYFLYRPPEFANRRGERLPLVVVLHHAGAERRLMDMFATPRASGAGWSQKRSGRIRALWSRRGVVDGTGKTATGKQLRRSPTSRATTRDWCWG